jgi:copper(I)-binding protein
MILLNLNRPVIMPLFTIHTKRELKMKPRIFIVVLFVSLLTACAPTAQTSKSQAGIVVEQARIVMRGKASSMSGMNKSDVPTPAAGMDMGVSSLAGYLIVKNTGSVDDQLLGVSADFAGMIMLHETVIKDNVASMQQIHSIDVPAGQTVTLEPGGFHIMFMNLKSIPNVGDKVTLTLTFQKAGVINVQADVTGE